ncbi:hypothetical protein ABIA28_006220 [Bradyrhizobium elkanii]
MRRTRSLGGLDVLVEHGEVGTRFGEILVGLRTERRGDVRDLRLRFGQLSLHLGCLPIKSQHLDLGHDLLLIQPARQGLLALQELEGAGEAGDLLVENVDVLRDLLTPHLEHAGLRRDGGGNHLVEIIREGDLGSAARLGVETRHPRRHRRAALADLAELGSEFRIVDAHQGLALLNDVAFPDQDVADDPAFERLNHLHLSRRHDAAAAALDLVQHGKMSPDQERRKQRARGPQQHAGGARRAQQRRGPDIICKGEIGRRHNVFARYADFG